MEKVSFNSCVYTPCMRGVQQNQNISAPAQTNVFAPSGMNNANLDTVNIRSKKEIYLEKLNKLFPNGGIDRVYNEINKDFGIDKVPTLKLCDENDGAAGGGYTFNKNEISLSLSDLMASDTKIVGIKDGKRTVITSPKVKLPLFIDQKTAQYFIFAQSKNGNMGFDKLVAEPLTEDEQRKFITQKISHEVIHAQQHQIMRETEGIGEKEIFKAWTHYKPKNMIDEYVFNFRSAIALSKTYWGNQPKTETKYSADSKEGQMAKEWLEAVRNYPPVDSPEYEKNAIERDAYERSAQYADDKYGAWA